MTVSIRTAIAGLTCLLSACQTLTTSDLDHSYRAAVLDAATVDDHEVTDTLIAIAPGNKRLVWNDNRSKLLVVTWKSQEAFDRFFKSQTATSENEAFVVWVTLAPQVQEFCTALARESNSSKDSLDLALKQYLGLNPDWNYDVFVEMWVSPDDLFRPCTDPDTSDTSCDLEFGDTNPNVKRIADYKAFYTGLYYKSFRSGQGVPWTGLGYTYDWSGNETEIGASEFIMVPGAGYEIAKVTPTLEYCAGSMRAVKALSSTLPLYQEPS